MLVASGCACARLTSSAQGNDSKSWTIGNDHVKRVITFQSGKGLFTTQLSALSTRTDFIAPAMPVAQEFSFRCDEIVCAGTNAAFDFLSADETSLAHGKSLTLHLRHKKLPLDASVIYAVYDGHPAIRKHLLLRNTGTKTLHISHLNIEAINIALGPENETTLLTQYGTIPREIFYTGRSEDAALL